MHFRLFAAVLVVLGAAAVEAARDMGLEAGLIQTTAVRFQADAATSSSIVLAKQKRQNSDIHVTMYMTSWCPYCSKAREYLKGLGVKLTEYDIEKDPAKKAEMKKLNKGSTGVPLISVEGIMIPGYAPEAIKEAVEKRKNSEVKV